MTPAELLQGSSTNFFTDGERNAVIAASTVKNGKRYLTCLVRKKEVLAKPEEIVRQLWLQRLTQHYGYPAARLAVEHPITFGRDTSKRADIVVFDADRPTVPYIIVEVKQGKLKDGKGQLKSYCHATGAPMGVWSNGEQLSFYHRKDPNYFEDIPAIPSVHENLPFPCIDEPTQQEIVSIVQSARIQKKKSNDLLEAAKRAVEIAIEDSEEAAMAYLQPFLNNESDYNEPSKTSQCDDQTNQTED